MGTGPQSRSQWVENQMCFWLSTPKGCEEEAPGEVGQEVADIRLREAHHAPSSTEHSGCQVSGNGCVLCPSNLCLRAKKLSLGPSTNESYGSLEPLSGFALDQGCSKLPFY